MAWYDAPQVDWSALSDIPKMWAAGKEWRQEQDLNAARKKAFSSGVFDPQTAVQQLLAFGDVEGASKAASIAKALRPEGLTPYQSEMIDLRRQELGQKQPPAPAVQSFFDESGREVKKVWTGSEWVQQGGAKSAAQNLTNVDKQAILEADERVRSATAADSALDRALQLNKQAYSGPLAGTRGYATSLLGREGGVATEELGNVVIGQALEQLKGIFGGMPTEGERKILIDLQGSVNQAPEVRERIFQRAKVAVAARKRFYQERAQRLRGGSFYEQDDTSFYGDPGVADPSATTIPKAAPPPPNRATAEVHWHWTWISRAGWGDLLADGTSTPHAVAR